MFCEKCKEELLKTANLHEHAYIDATPDGNYALRILKHYREMCNCTFTDNLSGIEPESWVAKQMNENNEKRAKELDWAIEILLGGHFRLAPNGK